MIINRVTALVALSLILSACGGQTTSPEPQPPIDPGPTIPAGPVGRFTQVQKYDTGVQTPVFPAVLNADLDGDGHLDIVYAGQRNIIFMKGDGQGKFSKSGKLDTPYMGNDRLAVGDLNDDGRPDLAIARIEYNDPMGFVVFLNQGNFTFQAAGTYHIGSPEKSNYRVSGIQIEDFNHDGLADILTANYTNNNVSLYLGAGNGTFADQKVIPTPGVASILQTGDFNNDGLTDILLGDGNGNFTLGLYTADNNFDITDITPQITRVYGGITSFGTDDVNGDGILDFLSLVRASDSTNGPTVSGVYLNTYLRNKAGGFTYTSSQKLSNDNQAGALSLIDVNNDGHRDVFIHNNITQTMSLFERQPDGAYAPVLDLPLKTSTPGGTFGNFNQDNKVDFAYPDQLSSSLIVFLQ